MTNIAVMFDKKSIHTPFYRYMEEQRYFIGSRLVEIYCIEYTIFNSNLVQ